jgi:hypothetical protein
MKNISSYNILEKARKGKNPRACFQNRFPPEIQNPRKPNSEGWLFGFLFFQIYRQPRRGFGVYINTSIHFSRAKSATYVKIFCRGCCIISVSKD